MARKSMTQVEALRDADTRRLSTLEDVCGGTTQSLLMRLTGNGRLDQCFSFLIREARALHLDAHADELAQTHARGFDTWDSARGRYTWDKRSLAMPAVERLRLNVELELLRRQRETRQLGAATTNDKRRKAAADLANEVVAEDRRLRANGYAKKAARISFLQATFHRGETFIKKCLKSGSRRSP